MAGRSNTSARATAPATVEAKKEEDKIVNKEYKILANINGYKRGKVYKLTANEVKAFGEKYIQEVK